MKLKTLAERYKYTCYWCKKKFPLEDLSRDHIIPYGIYGRPHKGGGDAARGKCVLACIFCNQKRGNKPFEVFKEEIENNVKKKNLFESDKENLLFEMNLFKKP